MERQKTAFDLMIGRRIQETIDLLRFSTDSRIQSLVKSIYNVDWKELTSNLPYFGKDEVYVLGRLSALMRMGRDVYALGQPPIIITKDGTVVQNVQLMPIKLTNSLEEATYVMADYQKNVKKALAHRDPYHDY